MPPWSAQEQRGVNDPVGPGASSPTWGQVQQLNSGEGILNLATLGAYRPVKRAVKRAYNWAYTEPAQQQKDAYDRAASDIRGVGQRAAGMYDQRGATAINRFDRAGGILGGYQPSTQSQNAYNRVNAGYGNTYTGDFYRNYQAPTAAQGYAQRRQALGYGPNQVADRYSARSQQSGPQYLESSLPMLFSHATGPTTVGGRLQERRGFAGTPTSTSSELSSMRTMDPSQRSDSLRGEVLGMDAGRFSGEFADELARGDTSAGQFRGFLGSNQSDTGQFMDRFDPTSTQGLRATYDRLAAEGPTYEEQFYTSQLTGDNPAYNQLRDDAMRSARNSAAARGGFASGMALDNERRTASRLAADEFARRGELAATAGGARRERLGQQLAGAEALDSNLLGRESLRAETGLGRERMMTDLVGQEDSLRAGLAQNRDAMGMDRMRLAGDLSTFGDTQATNLADMRLRAAGQQDDLLRRDQDAMDTLATSDDATRTTRMTDYAGRLGEADTNRMTFDRDLDALSNNAATQGFQREQQMDDVFQRGVDELQRGEDRRLTGATAADTAMNNQSNTLINAGSQASQERRDNFKTQFDSALSLGQHQAAMQMAYDMAAIGAITQADLSSIDMQLARAGVDAATRQAFFNNLLQVGGLAVKAYGAAQGAGA